MPSAPNQDLRRKCLALWPYRDISPGQSNDRCIRKHCTTAAIPATRRVAASGPIAADHEWPLLGGGLYRHKNRVNDVKPVSPIEAPRRQPVYAGDPSIHPPIVLRNRYRARSTEPRDAAPLRRRRRLREEIRGKSLSPARSAAPGLRSVDCDDRAIPRGGGLRQECLLRERFLARLQDEGQHSVRDLVSYALKNAWKCAFEPRSSDDVRRYH